MHVRAQPGTRIEETARLFEFIEQTVRGIIPSDQLDNIVDNIGLPFSGINMAYQNTGTIGPEDGDALISLKEDHAPTAEYVKRLRTILPQKFPGATFSFLPADIVSQILTLNPVLTVSRQIGETLRLHQGLDAYSAGRRAVEMLRLVHIPEPERRARQYPHQLSGGMRQRVMIAMALACNPKLLIADEPTTALDVTIQAQILDLMRELKAKTGTAIILITHDLGVVAEMAQRVVVMYAGRKLEEAPVRALFVSPRHPYTLGLLASVPRLGAARGSQAPQRLAEIPGTVPSLRDPIVGCAFAQRCRFATERCHRETPPLEMKTEQHLAACFESDRIAAS